MAKARISWTAHPARERPRDLILVIAVLLLSCGAVLESLGSLFLTALAAVMIIAAVAPFLFPTHYTLTDASITQTRLGRSRTRALSELRRLAINRDWVLVSPFSRPHWLERYRGLVLFLDGADRRTVIDTLRTRINTGQIHEP